MTPKSQANKTIDDEWIVATFYQDEIELTPLADEDIIIYE